LAETRCYTVTLIDANNYTVLKNITVNGTAPITANLTSSTSNAETGDDITFTCTTPNTATIEWNMGDGSTFQSSIFNYQYQQAGIYTVTLTVTNADGCSSWTTQTITVSQKVVSGLNNITNKAGINIWSNENNVFIDFSKQIKVDATIEIYNVLGQQLVNEKFARSTIYTKPLNNLAAAYVIVRVKNEGEVKVQRVFITTK